MQNLLFRHQIGFLWDNFTKMLISDIYYMQLVQPEFWQAELHGKHSGFMPVVLMFAFVCLMADIMLSNLYWAIRC
jgi:hypothetical protein